MLWAHIMWHYLNPYDTAAAPGVRTGGEKSIACGSGGGCCCGGCLAVVAALQLAALAAAAGGVTHNYAVGDAIGLPPLPTVPEQWCAGTGPRPCSTLLLAARPASKLCCPLQPHPPSQPLHWVSLEHDCLQRRQLQLTNHLRVFSSRHELKYRNRATPQRQNRQHVVRRQAAMPTDADEIVAVA